MTVGDYIHAKEADQLHPSMGDVSNQQRPSRQTPDEQTGVGVSQTRFTSRFHAESVQQQQQQPQPQEDVHQERHRSVFDTDVEAVDDSTLTVTSVADVEENRPFIPSFYSQHLSRNWSRSPVSDLGRRSEDFSNAVGAEEDQSRSAGSPAEEDADDEKTQTLDWISSQAYRSAGATTGSRREDQSRVTNREPFRMDSDRMDGAKVTSTRFISTSDMMKTVQLPYRNGHRKNVLSQSLATTPQNRFNFKNERPYERLIQQSPTRRASGPRPQPGRQKSTPSPQKKEHRKQDSTGSSYYYEERVNRRGSSGLDASDDEDFDDTDSLDMRIPEQSKASKSASAASEEKRFKPDYPQEVLQKKSFSDLENEPFDFIPATSKPSPSPPQSKQPKTAAEKLSLVQTLSEEDRHAYLSSLSITEWEEFGDQLIVEFSNMLTKIKDARQARRQTAALFEAEIKRRHELAQKQYSDLDRRLSEMKEGGLGVLRGAAAT
ncbi:hypothetical protein VTN77DRAFT_1799 [Rasamsonia byssochlamydoides]|uniref:uncharacterized protein n=1 Tax=Rasamsonia byssochlamydoides TaxID=89139 RepID=UPI0037423802